MSNPVHAKKLLRVSHPPKSQHPGIQLQFLNPAVPVYGKTKINSIKNADKANSILCFVSEGKNSKLLPNTIKIFMSDSIAKNLTILKDTSPRKKIAKIRTLLLSKRLTRKKVDKSWGPLEISILCLVLSRGLKVQELLCIRKTLRKIQRTIRKEKF